MKLKLLVLFFVVQAIAGFRISEEVSTLLLGGDDVEEGQASYQCKILKNDRFLCSCAIISDKWVVSSAHSFGIPTTLTVQVGSNHLLGGKEYKIANVYLHENRGDLNTFFGNDIAAIKLSKRIEFNENVQPIELGTEELPKGAVLTVTGWGKTRKEDYDIADVLQFINVTALPSSDCEGILGKNYHESILCVSNKVDEGISTGDSGDPLVYNNKLYGISSFGNVHSADGGHDMYAKISNLHEWIEAKTKKN